MSKQYKSHSVKKEDIKVGLECWYKDLKTVVVAVKDNEVALEGYDERGVFIGYTSKPYYTIVDHYKTREEIKTVTECDSCPILSCLNRTITNKSDNCPLEYIKYKDGTEFRPLEIEQ